MSHASGGHPSAAHREDHAGTDAEQCGSGSHAADEKPHRAANGRIDCETFHRISRALADPQRFALLQRLTGGREVACQQLVEAFPVTQATISHHLKELHAAGLITCRRDGKCVHLRADRDMLRAYQRELGNRLGTPRRRATVKAK